MIIDPNDQRLTAFALGELEGDDAAQLEKALAEAGNEDARRVVEEIRGTATMLTDALGREPAPLLTDEQRARIESPAPRVLNQPFVFRRRHIVGALAAACVALALVGVFAPRLASVREQAVSQHASAPPIETSSRDELVVVPGTELRTMQESNLALLAQAADVQRQIGAKYADEMPSGSVNTFRSLSGLPGVQTTAGGQGRPTIMTATAAAPPPVWLPASSPGGNLAAGSVTTFEKAPGLNVNAALSQTRFGLTPEVEDLVDYYAAYEREPSREQYEHVVDNPFIRPDTSETALSTFAADVDTASYTNVRRIISGGALPPAGAVRIEELINYFRYDYAPPSAGDEHPFAVHVEVNEAPWNTAHRLVKIGIKGREIDVDQRPATNLVFLLDVSGSMSRPDKLPLVKRGIKMLVDRLNTDDRMALVVYAGAAGLVLPSTYGYEKEAILDALDRLEAGGSTAGAAGIELAYEVATAHFIEGGVNRVILCTDGDFNVGVSDDDSLVRLIEKKRETGVFLSVFGFGRGNLQDAKMEKLSGHGNGTYGYIDGVDEAHRVFVEDVAGTLVTIAKDVKFQVDFNPARVGAYRLIGYENRLLANQDFNDDTKDAGDIGAGHTVTALYEIAPPGVDVGVPEVEGSKYVQTPDGAANDSPEMLTVRVRYKQPDADVSTRFDHAVIDQEAKSNDASADFRFAGAVASFGMILRDSPYRGDATLESVLDLAQGAVELEAPDDRENQRRQAFVSLVERAKAISQ